jgi:hypothetical protein
LNYYQYCIIIRQFYSRIEREREREREGERERERERERNKTIRRDSMLYYSDTFPITFVFLSKCFDDFDDEYKNLLKRLNIN